MHALAPTVPSIVSALASALAPGALITDPDVLAGHARDHAPTVPAGRALAMVRARSEADVVATLQLAHAQRVPVVPRGAGTGLSGGANAIDGCVLLDLSRMDRILELDAPGRTATVEPGVLNGALAEAVRAAGLFYAPDPSSRDISTLGGNVATNAGGACCLKYGVTGDHVLALRAILADGTPLAVGARTRKDVAGLDLKRLLVGSEGTLAVVTRITLRLLPAPPPRATLIAFFDTLPAAGAAVDALVRGEDLALVELMDRTTLGAVEAMAALGLDPDAAAMLLVQSDARDAEQVVRRCEALAEAAGGRDGYATGDADEGRMLLQARRMALPALERLGTPLLDDVCVPPASLPAMVAACERAAEETGLTIGTFGHAGDGNLHPTIVHDATDPASVAAAERAFDAIVHAALTLGGTVTGEHGVGLLKRRHLAEALGGAERALMGRIKAAFDPHGILNPGKAF
ncbi:MAG: FAD-linked oxidase C-terminal domain-containing protein [Myxococcota bacterium]